MTSLTPTHDLPSIVEGDDEPITINFHEPNGDPTDITGWTIEMTIAEIGSATPLIQKSETDPASPTDGSVTFALTHDETSGLTGTKRYDIQVTYPNGTVETYVLGRIGFRDGVTDS